MVNEFTSLQVNEFRSLQVDELIDRKIIVDG